MNNRVHSSLSAHLSLREATKASKYPIPKLTWPYVATSSSWKLIQ
jgi:hypothetical protein